MVTKVSVEFFKFLKNCLYLRGVLNDTLHYMEEISIANLFPGENVREMFLNNDLLESLHKDLEYKPAIVIMGQNCHTKAVLVNCILGQIILPLHSSQWRWLRFQYGRLKRIRLTVAGAEFEIVENLQANDRPWMIVPEADLKRPDHEQLPEQSTILEVELPYAALRDQVQIIVTPDCSADSLSDILAKGLDQVLPVILYAISDESLNEENILEIRKFKELYSDVPILFISVAGNISPNLHDFAAELTESEQHELEEHVPRSQISGIHSEHKLQTLRRQFENLGFISSKDSSHETLDIRKTCFTQYSVNSLLISAYNINDKVTSFVRACFQFRLVKSSALLSEVHNNCLRKFILSAFDMAREIQITPRRMKYAQSREAELYRTLIEIANEKQDEITRLIQVTLQNMKANIHEILEEYNSNHTSEGTEPMPPQTMKIATTEIQQLVLQKLRNSVASELVRSFDCLKESFTGTLQRCLESLEKNFDDQEISLSASDAVKQILNAAYNVDLKSSTSFSLVHTLMEKLRKLLHSVHIPWSTSSQLHLNAQWRQQVASDMIDSLHSNKLAKAISIQFQERIKSSHDSFQSAMRALENHYMGKLEQTDEQRVAIRKHHAPRFARLALESTSMCDMVRWGMPVQGKEIGRGQYGVVFACDPWGGVDPCAVKSVVPPDERHWNDLAMEFYYTRSITEHPRIVKLRGSVVDHSYAGGNSPAVLLIMERMIRDLYCGLRTGLSWRKRLQIAIDVVEGIRYLHSQGLVHRDIKLKNVLLDRDDRAKLTDLGFCIPEAMMSGSIVGTPVHMAPELLSGSYDSSVDVYAFGILFWYICAGHVRLPYVFEQFHNKEQLWNNVKKGIRPECLPNFDESCWHLMEQCWSGDPSHRPLLGDVQPQLEAIMKGTYDLIN